MTWMRIARCAALVLTAVTTAAAPVSQRPWMNPALSADQRAALVLAKMTRDEKLTIVFGYFASDYGPKQFVPAPGGRPGSAGYVPGIARLGIPAQWQTDAGVGVATQGSAPVKRERTALPSGMATAATWNVALARAGGAMIGAEARASGFNVMLAGGVNLAREPRNGRNFEYGGEDPLLAGTMVGAQIAGIQSNHVISTIKHFAFNDQETGRKFGNSVVTDAVARESDLLAFQIAIEQGSPGSVMCSYNRVNGTHACENAYLLTDVLRRDWNWPGYVMSDWGATHSTVAAAKAGLDQDSGFPFDDAPYFGKPLAEAVAAGAVSEARLDTMARRILRTMFAHGLFDHPVIPGPTDFTAHARVTRMDAEEGAVLLKNAQQVLPLTAATRRIAVIGGHADQGVLSGGGSSQVYPVGGNAVPGLLPSGWPGPVVYYPSAPLEAIRRHAPRADVRFDPGKDVAAAAKLASASDVAIVFVTQWATESEDTALGLGDQDRLIAAVAAANPHTVVVIESGGAVLMPWVDQVSGIVAAWYPGTSGGAAIGNVLFGTVNPSGRLPVTFPQSTDQLAHPAPLDAGQRREDDDRDVVYADGAAVGYKWFDKSGLEPLFPFGHGLSYTRFAYDGLVVSSSVEGVRASFTVRNTGQVAGKDVPQIYVSGNGWEAPRRLGGWSKVALAPGQSRRVSVMVDPRLLARFDSAAGKWRIAGGTYRVSLAASSRDIRHTVAVTVKPQTLAAGWRPIGAR